MLALRWASPRGRGLEEYFAPLITRAQVIGLGYRLDEVLRITSSENATEADCGDTGVSDYNLYRIVSVDLGYRIRQAGVVEGNLPAPPRCYLVDRGSIESGWVATGKSHSFARVQREYFSRSPCLRGYA